MNANPQHPARPAVRQSRPVERIVAGRATAEGAGVKLTRVFGQTLHRRLDPFLMLDAFRSSSPQDYIAGFPAHPHRGFETITYMLAGRMRHRDSAGNEGLLDSGGMQWMLAGRGVIHSEMPEQDQGLLEGFQLWLNLPARDKLVSPDYQDFTRDKIPEFHTEAGTRVRVLMGASHGVSGAVQRPVTAPLFLDIQLPAGARHAEAVPIEHHAAVYVYRGDLRIAGAELSAGQLAILANASHADGVILEARQACGALLIAGHPLGEPIAQHGPFVMNTQDQIKQAIADYQAGKLA